MYSPVPPLDAKTRDGRVTARGLYNEELSCEPSAYRDGMMKSTAVAQDAALHTVEQIHCAERIHAVEAFAFSPFT